MPARKTTKRIKDSAGRTAVMALAAALLLWAGLNLYQRIQFHQAWKDSPVIAETATAKTPQEQTPKNTQAAANQHIFGQLQQTRQAAEVTHAPATRLNLTLIGVIAGKEDGVSKAIIQIDNTEVGVFSVGDSLPRGNAKIERIEATQVLLERNGKLESLAIIRPELENE